MSAELALADWLEGKARHDYYGSVELILRTTQIELIVSALRLLAQPVPAQAEEQLYRKVITHGMTESEPGMTQEEADVLPQEEWWFSAPPVPVTTIQYIKVPVPARADALREENERLREVITLLAIPAEVVLSVHSDGKYIAPTTLAAFQEGVTAARTALAAAGDAS